jgi:transcriptional regulator with XRE-family HTH domain
LSQTRFLTIIVGIAVKTKLPISVRSGLKRLGESLRKARLRRRLRMVTVADRAGISRETLAKIQRGDPGVSMGNYAAVIFALGLGTGWMSLADITEDTVGQTLDDERLPKRARESSI